MMRRILACLVAVACILVSLASCALAEGEIIGNMKVIKVKQAVNLRQGTSTETPSLGLVPLGTVLEGCRKVEGSEWIAVTYEGKEGYIRGDFLELVSAPEAEAPAEEPEPVAEEAEPEPEPVAEEPEPEPEPEPEAEEPEPEPEPAVEEPEPEPAVEEPEPEPAIEEPEPEAQEPEPELLESEPLAEEPEEEAGDKLDLSSLGEGEEVLNTMVNGVQITATRYFTDTGELLYVKALDQQGNRLWSKHTRTQAITELTQTEAFVGGTLDTPMILTYNAESGLRARDLFTGESLWKIEKAELDLGASISYAVGGSGIMYIGGYYGPDPVAIDPNGNVLWQSDSGDESIFWLYQLQLEPEGVACHYASMSDDNMGWVIYDYSTGEVNQVIYD